MTQEPQQTSATWSINLRSATRKVLPNAESSGTIPFPDAGFKQPSSNRPRPSGLARPALRPSKKHAGRSVAESSTALGFDQDSKHFSSPRPRPIDNRVAAVALYVAHYNFCRVHETLRTTPAVALGITDHVRSIGELIDAALTAVPLMPAPTASKWRRQFRVIQGGRA